MKKHFTTLLFLMLFFSVNVLAQQGWIRINQLGYLPQDTKVAVLVAKHNLDCNKFELVDAVTLKPVFYGTSVKKYGAWAAFTTGFRLNFSSFTQPGKYFIKAAGYASPVFDINNNVYDGTADFLLNYMRQQRSGYNPFLKDSCHTQDGFIVYHPDKRKDSTKINVSGGWHDASDYLQYVPTSATAAFQLLYAYYNNPGSFADHYNASGLPGANGIPDILDEAKWGIDWLLKMNPAKYEYYNQLADDRDHKGMRLPNKDSVKYAPNQGLARPAYFITGKPQGEKYKNKTQGAASSAGKFSSAFSLAAIVLKKYYPQLEGLLKQKAKDAYDFGLANPGNTQTISMVSPYIYAEDNYVDDMELAAALLHKTTLKKNYLDDALAFAKQEPVTPWMGADTAKHYQWYPFLNLGHVWAYQQGGVNAKKELAGNLLTGISRVSRRGASNPFLMGVPFIWCSNNLTSGILTQISLYKKLTGDHAYDEQEAALRDWLLGCNPWGVSMVCELPRKGISPQDPHSSLAYLNKYKLTGALVDGPVYGTIWNKLIGIKLYAEDEYADFQSPLVVYHDDYGDYSTNEPTTDGTAGLAYYFGEKQAEAALQPVTDTEGAIIKMPAKDKKVYLLFSAHDRGEGGAKVARALHDAQVKASFFFTGDFLREKKYENLLKQLNDDGHYIGIHSDKHLLYADWNRRDSLLITKGAFMADADRALKTLKSKGIKTGEWFLPPYEWYNKATVQWAKSLGLTTINFTPGTGTNADYTTPDMKNYKSNADLYNRLINYEKEYGLNGALILLHIGTQPERREKFYNDLPKIIAYLKMKGYRIERLP